MSQPYRTRMALINQFGNGRFARQQPRELGNLPFSNAKANNICIQAELKSSIYTLKLRKAMEYLRERGLYKMDVKVERITKGK